MAEGENVRDEPDLLVEQRTDGRGNRWVWNPVPGGNRIRLASADHFVGPNCYVEADRTPAQDKEHPWVCVVVGRIQMLRFDDPTSCWSVEGTVDVHGTRPNPGFRQDPIDPGLAS